MNEHTERADLLAELASARAALTGAVTGLSDEQLGERPTASTLCLGGLVKHVAAMEESWLRFIVEGPAVMTFPLPDGVTWQDIVTGKAREYPQWMIDHQNDFRMLPGDTLAGILARYEKVAAATEAVVTSVPDLSATREVPPAPWGGQAEVRSVRRVLIHVIAETVQHAGHADIVRESIDGRKAS
jgi:uncharacterized damage-inducible protein DinB